MTSVRSKLAAAFGVALTLGLLAAEPADARRGGSFGSRGSRTYSQPRHTETSPGYVKPVDRSMTAPAPGQPGAQPGAQPGGAFAPRPGQPGYAAPAGSRFGGFGGGLLGGLLAGGLIGGLMGHGWGGGMGGLGGAGGLLTILIQVAVIFLVVNLLMRLFRRRQSPAGGAMPWDGPQTNAFSGGPQGFSGGGFSGATPGATAVPPSGPAWEIPITAADQATFERLLIEIQDAFGREDYGALRERSTPEIMSYLAEELSENATHGRRNDVSGTRLVQADVGEAWREGDIDYATAALRYESIDLMRDRTTGAVVSGDPDRPTQAVELWTFARRTGEPWKLSAIQSN